MKRIAGVTETADKWSTKLPLNQTKLSNYRKDQMVCWEENERNLNLQDLSRQQKQ